MSPRDLISRIRIETSFIQKQFVQINRLYHEQMMRSQAQGRPFDTGASALNEYKGRTHSPYVAHPYKVRFDVSKYYDLHPPIPTPPDYPNYVRGSITVTVSRGEKAASVSVGLLERFKEDTFRPIEDFINSGRAQSFMNGGSPEQRASRLMRTVKKITSMVHTLRKDADAGNRVHPAPLRPPSQRSPPPSDAQMRRIVADKAIGNTMLLQNIIQKTIAANHQYEELGRLPWRSERVTATWQSLEEQLNEYDRVLGSTEMVARAGPYRSVTKLHKDMNKVHVVFYENEHRKGSFSIRAEKAIDEDIVKRIRGLTSPGASHRGSPRGGRPSASGIRRSVRSTP